ncbi:hypothetical protein V4D30_01195 [Thermodesulfovibrio sp. 3907-1M]|uniref:Lipoprotein n=1 Tax=Thermodesulfovibrio autotrophicus TaxID=3118333 RepID=A0AAU8GZ91_9BACT
MKIKLLLFLGLCLFLSACGPIQHSDLNKALLPEDSNIECQDRECYIKTLGLDKNPENPLTAIVALPYNKEVELNVWVFTPFVKSKKGDIELCIAKALKQVIPQSAVYFEYKPDAVVVYEINRVFMSGDGALIRRSTLTSRKCSWFTEIYGKLTFTKNNKTIELNGAGAKPGLMRWGDPYYTTWNACLDVANNISDVLIKEGYIKESDVKKAQVEK